MRSAGRVGFLFLLVVASVASQVNSAVPSSATSRLVFQMPGLSANVAGSCIGLGCAPYVTDGVSTGVLIDTSVDNSSHPSMDPLGNVYVQAAYGPGDFRCANGASNSGTAIGRLRPDNTYETVLTIDPVCESGAPVGTKSRTRGFDPVAGVLYVEFESFAAGTGDFLTEFVRVSGLPTLFEVVASYVPSPPSIVWRVPPMPEAFPGPVDSFDVLAGDLADLPDLSLAQAVACGVPTGHAPVAGEEVSVLDTLPDPVSRTGRYYVVGARRDGEQRLGRQYVGGALSGRPVAGVAGCP